VFYEVPLEMISGNLRTESQSQ